MKSRRVVVLGTVATHPYAGMAWMHFQIAEGLRRLGHDAYYMEVTSAWPYDPVRKAKVNDSNYAVPYVARLAEAFGMADRWAYRRSYLDRQWFGMSGAAAEELLRTADAVLNVTGATRPRSMEGLRVGNLVYVGTDPVYPEIALANGDPVIVSLIEEHDCAVTYGENIGTPASPVPPLPRLKGTTRQPVLIDLWQGGPPTRPEFTTVCNWRHSGYDIEFGGETYYYSKHLEFLKIIDLPRRTEQPIEVAMGLVAASQIHPGEGELIPAVGMTPEERQLLADHRWKLVDAHALTLSPWPYRDYLRASRGEVSVAKDQYARPNSGWFSERSACYLAAGRPVITQDTGFGNVLPTGKGLFAFRSVEEAAAAIEAVNADYELHSRAASAIAEEYFRAETVLAKLLADLGV